MKKICSLMLIILMVALNLTPALAVQTQPYIVTVAANSVSFSRGGVVTGSYATYNNNIVLTCDTNNDLMVCFFNQENQYVGVSLGQQSTLTITGEIGTLMLHGDLNRPVVLGWAGHVRDLLVNAPVHVSIWGKVDEMSVSDDATVVAAKGSTIGKVDVSANGAHVYPNAGSNVGSVTNNNFSNVTTNTSTVGGITFYTDTIYASYGNTLGELLPYLRENVRAYNGYNRLSGTVEWEASNSTQVVRDQTYSFRFKPTDTRFAQTLGNIRVTVDDEGDDLDLETVTIHISSSSKRLEDYTSQLNRNVDAYNDSGRQVDGRARWVDSNERVRKTGWYEFIFVPTSSRYATVRDEIKIVVGDDDEDDDYYGNELYLDISEMVITSDTRRLRNLLSKLSSCVRVYDEDDERVRGKFEWVDDEDQIVHYTEDFQFRFIPNNDDYDEVTDWITIVVED